MNREPTKLMGLLNRRPDLTLAQFAQHWRTVHRDHSLALIAPGIMHGYIQNHRIGELGAVPGLPIAGDGFPELWTVGNDLLSRLASCREYLEGAYLDEPNFMDGRSQALLAREIVIDDGPGRVAAPTFLKVMLFFKRTPGTSKDAFDRLWETCRHPLLLPAAKPVRLTRQLTIPLPGDAGAAYEGVQTYDGQEASYWRSADEFLTAWAGRRPAPACIDEAQTIGVFVREEPVLFPIHPARDQA